MIISFEWEQWKGEPEIWAARIMEENLWLFYSVDCIRYTNADELMFKNIVYMTKEPSMCDDIEKHFGRFLP